MPNRSGNYYISAAKKNGLQVINGKGSHAKIVAPAGRGYMIVPLHRELSDGTEFVIRKWFKTLGIILTFLVIFLVLWKVI